MLNWLLQNRGNIEFLDLIVMLLAYAVMVFVMLPLHELGHAYMAHLLGDDTARWNGRLTLNPLNHLDMFGTMMLVLFGFGYARPVPVNPRNFRNPKTGMALTALAGPLSNLLLATASVAMFRLILFLFGGVMTQQVFNWLVVVFIEVFASVNIGLAVFNLLPIPPLDGSKILGFFLPSRLMYQMERYSHYISMALMAILLFTDLLDQPLFYLRATILGAILRLFGL